MTVVRTHSFEFHVYPADENGAMNISAEFTEWADCRDVASAKSKAGSLAKKHNGPVDLAYAGNEPWNERYLTTARPSEYHKKGFSFERLDG